MIEHNRRRIPHFNVTLHAIADWILQQLREPLPEAPSCRYAVLDHDSKFDDNVISFLRSTGLEPKHTSVQSPWQIGTAERRVGSCRREMLDHVIELDERRLFRPIRDYVGHHQWRPALLRLRVHIGSAFDQQLGFGRIPHGPQKSRCVEIVAGVQVRASIKENPECLDISERRCVHQGRGSFWSRTSISGGSALQQFFAADAAKAVDGALPKHKQAAQHIAKYKHLMEQMEKADASERPRLAFLMKGHVDKAIERIRHSTKRTLRSRCGTCNHRSWLPRIWKRCTKFSRYSNG